jgi:hypothetical protein
LAETNRFGRRTWDLFELGWKHECDCILNATVSIFLLARDHDPSASSSSSSHSASDLPVIFFRHGWLVVGSTWDQNARLARHAIIVGMGV